MNLSVTEGGFLQTSITEVRSLYDRHNPLRSWIHFMS